MDNKIAWDIFAETGEPVGYLIYKSSLPEMSKKPEEKNYQTAAVAEAAVESALT